MNLTKLAITAVFSVALGWAMGLWEGRNEVYREALGNGALIRVVDRQSGEETFYWNTWDGLRKP